MDTNTEIQTDLAEVPAPGPTPLFDYRGNGKVARLPNEILSRIIQMLDDGLPYLQIIQNLGVSAGPLTEKCIGSWKKGRLPGLPPRTTTPRAIPRQPGVHH